MTVAWRRLVVLLLVVAMVAAAGAGCRRQPVDEPGETDSKFGGVLKHAIIGNPPTLDIQWTTASVTHYTMWHVYETLFTMDASYRPIPHLVDTYGVSEDGLVWTFTLREGVKFHNGEELGAADAVASLERWGQVSSRGKQLMADVIDRIVAEGDYTFSIYLDEPVSVIPLYLTEGASSIYPKSVIDAVGAEEEITQYIGTGPYKFAEFIPDRYLKLVRYDDYSARSEAPNGYGGERVAYFDELQFIPVSDVAVRIAGVQTGEYHFGEWIPPDDYERLQADPSVSTVIVKPSGWTTAVFNKKEGVFTDVRMRQALLAALEMESIMRAAYGHEDFWRLDPGLMPKEHAMWTDAGSEFYNQADPQRAAQLLDDAGYDGTPIRWVTTMDYPAYYTTALVAAEQLETAGFVVDLQVVDWATVVSKRSRPDEYEIFSTAFGFNDDPVQVLAFQPAWPGWYESEQMQSYIAQLRREDDFDERMEIWRDAQQLFWEDVPVIKFGDYFLLHIHVPRLQNYQGMRQAFFWNTWLD